jgi:hypothetical protein
VIRLAAQEEKERERAVQAAIRAEKKEQQQLEKQLQNDVQLSKKAKRQARKQQAPSVQKNNEVEPIISDSTGIPSLPVLTRRGRDIKAPARYR